ncbi:diaminopimelate decarboxylase [Corynebacterium amycolatum]|uniref:Diaminopimelate decarboxylase n=1 Tax=Corynebacterium amycolatum TaxID=43765 RepID=A0AAW9SST7_CORAY|nr:diaminopimelate decarboxylase [Corynebacterium amycolatum]MDK7237581.1 diaminopimelate decarboxylase [Corynebacterium amycolatum]MDK7247284.1 diaminopimelate decarboxylase [Corynebacterium amycolatum]
MPIDGNGFELGGYTRPDSTQFNELPAHVWPTTARRRGNDEENPGSVEIGGVSLVDIAKEFGTPVFVVDEQDFRSRCRSMAKAFRGAENVHYASKAFLSKTIARWVMEEGLHLDVASGNEMAIALAAGFPAKDMTFHGNNKSTAELRDAISAGVGKIVLDSRSELRRLSQVAAEAGVVQDVLVRVKPGVEAHTHEFIATAHEDQKFGFSLASGSALEAANLVEEDDNLRLIGLHCHIGSQIVDSDGFILAAERVFSLVEKLVERHGTEISKHFNTLDLGGGFGIAYTAGEQPLDVAPLADEILTAVDKLAQRIGIETPTVAVEPGRAIVGPSMVTVYEVGTLKDVTIDEGMTRRYVSVNGGMSDNIRPALYGSNYDGRVVNREVSGSRIPTRVVGKHCESGDILINDANYPDDIVEGDLFALAATGAYCYAMASRYNMLTRPPVVSVCDGQVTQILRRETVQDLLSLECETPR